MRRWLLTFCWTVSLLLFAGVCLMWVRSYWLGDAIEWQRVTRDERIVWSWYLVLSSGRGGAGIARDAEDYDVRYATVQDIGSRWSRTAWRTGVPTYPQLAFFGGVGNPAPAFVVNWRGGAPRRELIVPYWMLALLFAIAPAVRLRRLIKERRGRSQLARGRCAVCGYDLRATPDRCPECGAPGAPSPACNTFGP